MTYECDREIMRLVLSDNSNLIEKEALALTENNYHVISFVDDNSIWEYQDCHGNPIDGDVNVIIAWREIEPYEVTE